MYTIAQLKPGVAITLDGEPYLITKAEFSKQARQGGNMKTTMKNLKTGANVQRTFSGNDKVEPADLERSRCQYLYDDGNKSHFMHNETYEQFAFSAEDMGDAKNFLVESGDANVLFYEGNAIGVEVPAKVDLKVKETIPGVKGDTAQGGSKPATLETGLVVNVPLFINEGDTIKINTSEKTYVERV